MDYAILESFVVARIIDSSLPGIIVQPQGGTPHPMITIRGGGLSVFQIVRWFLLRLKGINTRTWYFQFTSIPSPDSLILLYFLTI